LQTACLAAPVNYISIPVSGAGSMRCAEVFGNEVGDTQAGAVFANRATTFQVTYVSDDTLTAPVGTGFNLDYAQIPCN